MNFIIVVCHYIYSCTLIHDKSVRLKTVKAWASQKQVYILCSWCFAFVSRNEVADL